MHIENLDLILIFMLNIEPICGIINNIIYFCGILFLIVDRDMNITQIIDSFFKKDRALDIVLEKVVKTLAFVSYFEALITVRRSARSIRMVKVCNGAIFQEFCSLIKSIPDCKRQLDV